MFLEQDQKDPESIESIEIRKERIQTARGVRGSARSEGAPPSLLLDRMEHLKSNLHLFDAHLRLLIAIACKLATLKVFANRYASLDDDAAWDEEEPSDADTSRRELKAEQKLAAKLQSTTSKEAAAWLALVCAHLQVDLASLPSSPSPDPLFAEAVPDTLRFEIAHELVLVSLGLAIPADAPPPELNYSALSRALVVRAAATLGIQLGVVESAEKAISQFLYFQLKAVEDQEGANGKGDWDEAASAGRKEASGKRKALKWAATGAGFVLGGVAIGLTGGTLDGTGKEEREALMTALRSRVSCSCSRPPFGWDTRPYFLWNCWRSHLDRYSAGSRRRCAFKPLEPAISLIGVCLSPGGLASYRTHRRMKGLDELSFESIKLADVPSIPSLTATIVCSGFLLAPEDSVEPWQATFENSGKDVFALKADPESESAWRFRLPPETRLTLLRSVPRGGTGARPLRARQAHQDGIDGGRQAYGSRCSIRRRRSPAVHPF